MPGIDLRRLRHEITIQQVLDLLGFVPTARRGRACAAHARSMATAVRKAGSSLSTSAVIVTAASVATLPERNSTCGPPSII